MTTTTNSESYESLNKSTASTDPVDPKDQEIEELKTIVSIQSRILQGHYKLHRKYLKVKRWNSSIIGAASVVGGVVVATVLLAWIL